MFFYVKVNNVISAGLKVYYINLSRSVFAMMSKCHEDKNVTIHFFFFFGTQLWNFKIIHGRSLLFHRLDIEVIACKVHFFLVIHWLEPCLHHRPSPCREHAILSEQMTGRSGIT